MKSDSNAKEIVAALRAVGPVVFDVSGVPAPKGSARAITIAGRATLIPSGSNANRNTLRDWNQAVKVAAWNATRGRLVFVDLPLGVHVEFRLARPKSHYGKRGLRPGAPRFPQVKPDVDKLLRSTFDAMKGVVYDDDARIVRTTVSKSYAAPGHEGAAISVEALTAVGLEVAA